MAETPGGVLDTNTHTMYTAITELAAEMAKHINENKSPEGYTIVCSHQELRHMVSEAIPVAEEGREGLWYADREITSAMNDFFEEMEWEHNMFLEVSQFDDIVLDERGEEF